MSWRAVMRDDVGNIILDLPTRLTRVLGTVAVSTSDGSVTNAALGELYARVWWKFIGNGDAPRAFLSGTTIIWDWSSIPASRRSTKTLIYGLF